MDIYQPNLLLISMPWSMLHSPSIQLATLKALLERENFSVATLHYYVDAAEYFISSVNTDDHSFTTDDYSNISNGYRERGLGDWIFGVPPFKDLDPERDEIYRQYLKKHFVSEPLIEKAFLMRSLVTPLLDKWLSDILRMDPKIVGFSCVFSQNVPSLVLSKMIKAANPEINIVFGGAGCDGPMGAAMLNSFSWIDAVFRGESETTFPAYVKNIINGDSIPLESLNGLCYRKSGEVYINPQTAALTVMDSVPVPNYDDYFEQIKRSKLSEHIIPRIRIPFESSRGCWWGAKQHCTFCGLNGTSMAFRSKSAERTYNEILDLSSKYQQIRFSAVDNIISMDHVRDLLPNLKQLREQAFDLNLFYETKVNLKKDQIKLMHESGIRTVQPGIESLSTPILKLMRKGTTALQNIRFLKWSEQFGIQPLWNIIYGFPNEPVEEYEKMVEIVSALTHLPPPKFINLGIERFSPYFNNPEKYGITIQGPATYYRFLYNVADAALNDLAYDFQFSYHDGRNLSYTKPLRTACIDWKREWTPGTRPLVYERGLNFLKIIDNRYNLKNNYYTLKKTEAEIYLACDAGAKPKQICKQVSDLTGAKIEIEEVEAFLAQLVNLKLIYMEDGIYLSLAIPRYRSF